MEQAVYSIRPSTCLHLTARKLQSRSGNVTLADDRLLVHTSFERPVTCCNVRSTTFMPVVLPDGMTCACCNDYGLELPVGNLLTGRWKDMDCSWLRGKQENPSTGISCFRSCHLAEPEENFCEKH